MWKKGIFNIISNKTQKRSAYITFAYITRILLRPISKKQNIISESWLSVIKIQNY